MIGLVRIAVNASRVTRLKAARQKQSYNEIKLKQHRDELQEQTAHYETLLNQAKATKKLDENLLKRINKHYDKIEKLKAIIAYREKPKVKVSLSRAQVSARMQLERLHQFAKKTHIPFLKQKTAKMKDIYDILTKRKSICKARKEKRREIMKKTAGKGLRIRNVKKTFFRKVFCR